jgi:hypothetical protein
MKINVKAMGVCGEEVVVKDMSDLKEAIRIRLLYAIPNLVAQFLTLCSA